jgi:hypothetical protein
MWPKEDYQEHMLGYLDGLQIKFAQLICSHVRQHDFNEFYANLDITSECLWRLIAASDADWEGFRYPLEASCDELLRAFYRVPYVGSLIPPASVIITEGNEWRSQSWTQAEVLR